MIRAAVPYAGLLGQYSPHLKLNRVTLMPPFDDPQRTGIIAGDIQAVDRIALVGLRMAEGIDLAVDQRLDECAVGYARAIQHDRAIKARGQRWKG